MSNTNDKKTGASYRPSAFGVTEETINPVTGARTTSFDWGNALVDGTIIALLTFFTTLTGTTLIGEEVDIQNILLSAGISAAAQFLLMIAIKRGLRAPNP